jgi:hypothetical protein
VAAKNLISGDTFAVARNIPGGHIKYSLDRAWLLGLLIGDGCLTVPSNVKLTCADTRILKNIPEHVANCGFSYRQTGKKGITFAYNITGGAVQWIRDFGLDGKSSHTKFIPSEVFTWNNESVGEFIRGYFEADGCVTPKEIAFSSVNSKLLLDTQSLLLRFGVVSSLRIKRATYKNQPYKSYILVINGSSMKTFAFIIGDRSDKGCRLQNTVESLGQSNDNIDLIPESVLTRLRVKRGCGSDKLDGCDISNRRKRGCLRRKVQTLACKQNRQDLYNESDLFWDEIVSVEFIGEQQTYSIEVDNTHVHITDDFITHNSYQTIGRVVWELGHNTDLRIKIIGSSDDKAKEILGLIKDTINSSKVQEVFPNLQIDSDRGDTKGAFFLKRHILQRDPSVEASGVLSTGAGGRADILICDDVVDLKNSVINPAMRDQVTNTIKETWFSLVAATGKIIWVATPYHVADATHNIKETGVFKVWLQPAITYEPHFDDNGDPIIDLKTNQQKITKKILWPDKWPEKKLEERRKDVGERVFARQYLLTAMSDEERTFPEYALEKSFDFTLADIGEDIDDDWTTFGGIDLASALGKKNAWTVIFTLAKNPHTNRLHIKEIFRRRMKFPEIMKAAIEQYRKHDWRLCYVENNQFQQAVIDALEAADKTMPVESFTTGVNKANEKVGLPAMSVDFEKNRFAVPAAKFPLNPDDPSTLAVFMNELRTHPGGEFSDTIMACWFAWSAAKKGQGDFEDAYMASV